MTARTASGLEQAVFGWTDARQVDDWVDRHVRERLGRGVDRVLFRSGRVGAVYGLRLLDGSDVVVKVPRGNPMLGPLTAATASPAPPRAHRGRCPTPLDGPAMTGGRVGLIEELLEIGEIADIRRTPIRRAAIASLAEQITLLADLPDEAGALTDPPAWERFRQGPWPTPHDTIFDFTHTPEGYEWLDHLAAAAAHQAATATGPVLVGHSDWYVGNLRFTADTVVAAYDWDNLVAEPEPVIAGFAAGSHTLGNATGPGAPTPEEVGTFLTEYAEHRPGSFTPAGRTAAAAAAVWVLAYHARCQLCFLPTGDPPPPGSTLQALAEHGPTYLALDW